MTVQWHVRSLGAGGELDLTETSFAGGVSGSEREPGWLCG